MSGITQQFPVREPLVDLTTGLLSDRWRIYFRDLEVNLAATQSVVVTPVAFDGPTAKTAAIVTTSIPTGTLAKGVYLAEGYMKVVTAAGVSSSATLTVGFTDNANACSFSGAAMTGNTTTTVQSNVWFFHVDQASPVTYAVAYASNPANAMAYSLYVALTQIASV